MLSQCAANLGMRSKCCNCCFCIIIVVYELCYKVRGCVRPSKDNELTHVVMSPPAALPVASHWLWAGGARLLRHPQLLLLRKHRQ